MSSAGCPWKTRRWIAVAVVVVVAGQWPAAAAAVVAGASGLPVVGASVPLVRLAAVVPGAPFAWQQPRPVAVEAGLLVAGAGARLAVAAGPGSPLVVVAAAAAVAAGVVGGEVVPRPSAGAPFLEPRFPASASPPWRTCPPTCWRVSSSASERRDPMPPAGLLPWWACSRGSSRRRPSSRWRRGRARGPRRRWTPSRSRRRSTGRTSFPCGPVRSSAVSSRRPRTPSWTFWIPSRCPCWSCWRGPSRGRTSWSFFPSRPRPA
mmetsp:Transcript_6599/g.15792  ORF Transcript_6599/g.15792 Transcript_6599/m.15792 type:complete len:262 (-) Transcript_6599:138-923(-)